MLRDNLIMLRNINGYSQEEIVGKIGISRQAYAKWENGQTVPDVEKCSLLAGVYKTIIDALVRTEKVEGKGVLPPAPIGKNIWGSVSINDRGQIVIPKEARNLFNLKNGDRLIVGSDENGIALIPAKKFEEIVKKGMEYMSITINKQ